MTGKFYEYLSALSDLTHWWQPLDTYMTNCPQSEATSSFDCFLIHSGFA